MPFSANDVELLLFNFYLEMYKGLKLFRFLFLFEAFVHFWINFKSMSLTSLAENGIY